MDGSGKLHGAVVEEGSQFRAECWLVDSKGTPLTEGRASKLFPSLEEARIWLEQQSHARGYNRIWLEH